jgi:hypothetical protein|tara:strand:- start:197 stop:781 length:585 start_codon:yes stop_codon:yes gene_type:complete
MSNGAVDTYVEITIGLVKVLTFILGPLVLISYVYGVSHSQNPSGLWGGVPVSWQRYIIPFMFLAALGYVVYWWIVFYHLDALTVESFRWPWGESDGNGNSRLLFSFLLILIPSALWIESTIFHIENDYSWTPLLVIGLLLLVSVGNLMLGLIAYSSYQDNISGSGYMLLGSIALGIQCILNDLIIWSYKFPWSE